MLKLQFGNMIFQIYANLKIANWYKKVFQKVALVKVKWFSQGKSKTGRRILTKIGSQLSNYPLNYCSVKILIRFRIDLILTFELITGCVELFNFLKVSLKYHTDNHINYFRYQ